MQGGKHRGCRPPRGGSDVRLQAGPDHVRGLVRPGLGDHHERRAQPDFPVVFALEWRDPLGGHRHGTGPRRRRQVGQLRLDAHSSRGRRGRVELHGLERDRQPPPDHEHDRHAASLVDDVHVRIDHMAAGPIQRHLRSHRADHLGPPEGLEGSSERREAFVRPAHGLSELVDPAGGSRDAEHVHAEAARRRARLGAESRRVVLELPQRRDGGLDGLADRRTLGRDVPRRVPPRTVVGHHHQPQAGQVDGLLGRGSQLPSLRRGDLVDPDRPADVRAGDLVPDPGQVHRPARPFGAGLRLGQGGPDGVGGSGQHLRRHCARRRAGVRVTVKRPGAAMLRVQAVAARRQLLLKGQQPPGVLRRDPHADLDERAVHPAALARRQAEVPVVGGRLDRQGVPQLQRLHVRARKAHLDDLLARQPLAQRRRRGRLAARRRGGPCRPRDPPARHEPGGLVDPPRRHGGPHGGQAPGIPYAGQGLRGGPRDLGRVLLQRADQCRHGRPRLPADLAQRLGRQTTCLLIRRFSEDLGQRRHGAGGFRAEPPQVPDAPLVAPGGLCYQPRHEPPVPPFQPDRRGLEVLSPLEHDRLRVPGIAVPVARRLDVPAVAQARDQPVDAVAPPAQVPDLRGRRGRFEGTDLADVRHAAAVRADNVERRAGAPVERDLDGLDLRVERVGRRPASHAAVQSVRRPSEGGDGDLLVGEGLGRASHVRGELPVCVRLPPLDRVVHEDLPADDGGRIPAVPPREEHPHVDPLGGIGAVDERHVSLEARRASDPEVPTRHVPPRGDADAVVVLLRVVVTLRRPPATDADLDRQHVHPVPSLRVRAHLHEPPVRAPEPQDGARDGLARAGVGHRSRDALGPLLVQLDGPRCAARQVDYGRFDQVAERLVPVGPRVDEAGTATRQADAGQPGTLACRTPRILDDVDRRALALHAGRTIHRPEHVHARSDVGEAESALAVGAGKAAPSPPVGPQLHGGVRHARSAGSGQHTAAHGRHPLPGRRRTGRPRRRVAVAREAGTEHANDQQNAEGDDRGDIRPTVSIPVRLEAQDAADARQDLAAGGGRGERRLPRAPSPAGGAELGDPAQGVRVAAAVAADADGQVVAAVLALPADLPRDPPDGRVVEQQRLQNRLQRLHQAVPPADVRQLVGEDRLHLPRRQAGHRADRQEDHRPQPADDHRDGHPQGFQQSHRPGDSQPPEHSIKRLLRRRPGRTCAEAPHAPHAEPAAHVPDGHRQHARQPDGGSPRQRRSDCALKLPRPGDGGSLLSLFRRSGLPWQRSRLEGLRVVRETCRGGRYRSRRGLRRRARRGRPFCRARRRRRFGPPRRLGGDRQGRRHRQRGHQGQRRTRHDPPRLGGTVSQQRQQHPQHQRHGRALPNEMNQGPADPLGRRVGEQLTQRVHRFSPRARSGTAGCRPIPRR